MKASEEITEEQSRQARPLFLLWCSSLIVLRPLTALIRRRPRVCGVLQEFEQWFGTMTCHRSAMDSALPKFEILSATEDTGDFRGGHV